jgi:hypothetical protein
MTWKYKKGDKIIVNGITLTILDFVENNNLCHKGCYKVKDSHGIKDTFDKNELEKKSTLKMKKVI